MEEHTVTVGNGSEAVGEEFSAKVTITGEVLHFSQTSKIGG